jgi:hypothetical protein
VAHSGRVGTFTYRYRGTAPDGASATIGLENADGDAVTTAHERAREPVS